MLTLLFRISILLKSAHRERKHLVEEEREVAEEEEERRRCTP